MGRTINSEEIGERSAAEFLREVARAQEMLRVVFEDGGVVTIDSRPTTSGSGEGAPLLKPLPQFDIVIPEGWKEAIYEID